MFHLAESGNYNALAFMVVLMGTGLLPYEDRHGNGVLHLAVLGKHHEVNERIFLHFSYN